MISRATPAPAPAPAPAPVPPAPPAAATAAAAAAPPQMPAETSRGRRHRRLGAFRTNLHCLAHTVYSVAYAVERIAAEREGPGFVLQ